MKLNDTRNGTDYPGFLRRVAQMYYMMEMTQQEIADRLEIGRSSVARFLKEAREAGIVEIRVHGIDEHVREIGLEKSLAERYGLRDAVVINSSDSDLFRNIAAMYIESVIPKKGSIVLCGGRTMAEVGGALQPAFEREKLCIVQGTGIVYERTTSVSVAEVWTRHLGAASHYLAAPGVAATTKLRDELRDEPIISNTVQRFAQSDLLICSVGDYWDSYARTVDFPMIHDALGSVRDEAVGDIALHFYNRDGVFCLPELSEKVVGISIDELMAIRTRVCIARGAEKSMAVRGALKGGLIHLLVTDSAVAEQLLAL